MKTILDEILETGTTTTAYETRGQDFNLELFGETQLEEEFDPNNFSSYQPLADEIIRLANQECTRWGNGSVQETMPSISSILQDYWKTGLGFSDSYARQLITNRTAWSAAFISWVLRKAGAGRYFRYASSHWKYVAQAKKGRMNKDYDMVYWLYKLNERKPRVGDLICKSRENSGLTYENAHEEKPRAGHCDIITKVLSDRVITVGGNVSNSVKETKVWLTSNGYFDPAKNSGTYFGIMSMW
jgi:hypothetical protein